MMSNAAKNVNIPTSVNILCNYFDGLFGLVQ